MSFYSNYLSFSMKIIPKLDVRQTSGGRINANQCVVKLIAHSHHANFHDLDADWTSGGRPPDVCGTSSLGLIFMEKVK